MVQCNKHGIPVITPKKRRKKNMNHLNHKEFAEFIRIVDGIEVTVVVLNFTPIVQAMKEDGWKLQKYSRGEIA